MTELTKWLDGPTLIRLWPELLVPKGVRAARETDTPADPLQTEVAWIALAAAKQHGFALRGGHALIAHGIVRRSTEDADLFTDSDDGVRAATRLVADALGDADLEAELLPDGFDDETVEFVVARDDQSVRVTLAHFNRLVRWDRLTG
ncbi:nucleotidyl transferase AbiEii/AbiGii toxin family protein [Allorhizocola rhizosphaerae]|uniref:nucleotidyl transferase AbiEii/AbiGii toxin family protein n=1 Tax=Allorhizocola rhizosphaerae TaxID=1872709 RepID=UPI001B8ABB0E|nr:nucleotidyl transferase AbiEii/AbiGii toxin family protein [Allorhizocola rhizosphaerae]